MNHAKLAISLSAVACLLAGCASTPPSHFYTLSSETGPAGPPSATAVVVGPVTVPAEVDRPQIVVTVAPNRVRLEEFHRWASPLDDEIARTIVADLVVMLGTPNVTTLARGGDPTADYRVAVEVQRFTSQPGTAAQLDAAWTVRRLKDGKSQSGRTTVQEPVGQPGYDAIAAAHSRAVARLAQDIAAATRTLEAAAR